MTRAYEIPHEHDLHELTVVVDVHPPEPAGRDDPGDPGYAEVVDVYTETWDRLPISTLGRDEIRELEDRGWDAWRQECSEQ